MSSKFYIPPEWMQQAEPPPPDLSTVDPHRVEGLVNRFIAAKQDALFAAPDAFYRQSGADAVDGAPALLDRLAGRRQSVLDQAQDDKERTVLGPRLDLHIDDARDGIDRHLTTQRDALARQTIAERQGLIRRAAELEHNNDDKLAGLAEAHASAAQELARMDGAPEEPAAASARSAVWRTALAQRLAAGDHAQAIALFDRIGDKLAPDDRRHVELPIRLAATDIAADRWIERATATPGEPIAARAAADPDLSPAEKACVLSKIAERTSATESARFATVKGLDDKLDAATRALATAPASYKPATFLALANAYEDAGEPDKAAAARRLAEQENILLRFARSSVEEQQRLIDALPADARDAARVIQQQQDDAFVRDPYAAGTALHPEVGSPLPADDIEGRLRQARMIEALRAMPMPNLTPDQDQPPLQSVQYRPGEDQRDDSAPEVFRGPRSFQDKLHPRTQPINGSPKVTELSKDFDPNAPTYHRYQFEDVLCDTKAPGCTAEAAYAALQRHGVPGGPRRGTPLEDGERTMVSVLGVPGGHVRTWNEPESRSIINVTEPDHYFAHGLVQRQIVVQGDKIVLRTYGEGINRTMEQALQNKLLARQAFVESTGRIRSDLNPRPEDGRWQDR